MAKDRHHASWYRPDVSGMSGKRLKRKAKARSKTTTEGVRKHS